MKTHYHYYSQSKAALEGIAPFAEGQNRLCFIHPDNPHLCIKIVKKDSIARLRSRRGFIKNLRSNIHFDDNLNEYHAHQQPIITNGGEHIYEHISRCYGWQETDIGIGLVSDYYADKNGDTAATLESYLHTHGFTDEIKAKLDDIANYLRETGLMTRNIIPHNIVIAADENLKIVDGLGLPSRFSIANISPAMKRRYIERRIDRMFLRAQWESSDKAKTWKQVEKAQSL